MALTPDRIVQAACAILDDYGLADLTMRRVADALGVKAGALYWHFSNKQSLLAAVADEVLGRSFTIRGGPEDSDVWDWARSFRDQLLAHRDAAELVASTRAMGLGTVDPAENLKECLRSRGVGHDDIDGVAEVFMHFVVGHSMQEQTQAQLAELGVVAPFDAIRAQRNFERGIDLLSHGVISSASTLTQVE
ncbi:MAG: TetR family transcriptional regulator [Arachnia sp.]